MYGTETWAVKKAQEKWDVAELSMLRWVYVCVCGVEKLYRIKNKGFEKQRKCEKYPRTCRKVGFKSGTCNEKIR